MNPEKKMNDISWNTCNICDKLIKYSNDESLNKKIEHLV